jgi:hypothetical protein
MYRRFETRLEPLPSFPSPALSPSLPATHVVLGVGGMFIGRVVRRDLRKISIKILLVLKVAGKKNTHTQSSRYSLEPHLSLLVPVTIGVVVGSGGWTRGGMC